MIPDTSISTSDMAIDLPLVFVSIVHWNGGRATIACIESVLAESYRPLRIVVVDNGSTDAISDEIEVRWPDILVVRNSTNTGFTGGHNLGISRSLGEGADFVMLLNQDALLISGCIGHLIALTETDARAGLVSPLVYYVDEPSRVQFNGSWLDAQQMAVGYHGNLDVVRAMDSDVGSIMCLWGTALLIRREVIEQIGVLDQRLFAYFEDTDYSARAAAAGWRNRMCFDAGILHEGHPTRYTRAPHFFYFTCRNERLFWRKTLPAGNERRILFTCLARTLREAAKMRDAGLHKQADACMSGFWDSLVGRYGAYDPNRRAPRWLSWLLLRHPYFLGNLLEGKWSELLLRRSA